MTKEQDPQAPGSASEDDGNDRTARARQHLLYYRDEIRSESQLLGTRLNAMISSQSFLTIAYASSMASSNGHWRQPFTLTLPPIMALLGMILVMLARPGLISAQAAIEHWRGREAELFRAYRNLEPYTLATDDASRTELGHRRREGALFAQRAPLVFIFAWLLFMIIPVVLYFWG